MNSLSHFKKHSGIFFIVLAGLIARLVTLHFYGDFWGDEMFSFVYSQKPWLASLHFWTLETNPPLHMVLLKLWWYIFPATELWARLPSVIFGTTSIWTLHNFAKKLFTERAALIAASLLALSPYHIFMSATARGYALFLLLVILSLSVFHSLFVAGETTRKNYWRFGLVTLVLLYIHLTSVLLLATELLYLVLFTRARIKKFFLTILPALLLWLLWAIPAFYYKLTNPSFGQAWFFNIEPGLNVWLEALHPLFGAMNPPVQFLLIILFLPVLLIYTVYQQKKNGRVDTRLLFILVMFMVPVTGATCFGLWNIKFFVVALPAAVVLTAYLIDSCFSSHILATLLLAGLVVPNLTLLARFLPAEDWRTVNTFVAAHTAPKRKQLFVYTNFTDQPRVARYFTGVMPMLPYYPYDTRLWDEMTITKNYVRSVRPAGEIATWYTQKHIDQYKELFLLQSSTLGQIDLSGFLEKNNWKLIDTTAPRLVGDDYQLRYYVHR